VYLSDGSQRLSLARHVYINADLLPVEAKMAYEERQRRCELSNRRTNTDTNYSNSNLINSVITTNNDICSHDHHQVTTVNDNECQSPFPANA